MTPVSTEAATPLPEGTTAVSATSGQSFIVTSGEGTAGLVLEGPASLASSVEGANVEIDGPGTQPVTIGTAVDADGNPISAAGTSYQVADDYEGSAVVNLNGAITGGTKVDTSTEAIGGGTIADNLPTDNANLDFYVNLGSGNDEAQGSAGNDFIRLGAGDDAVNAGAGDDIVRLGTGDDVATLGLGDDIIYLTVDQLQGTNAKAITDFDVNGNDKIQIDADLEGLVEIEGLGTNSIRITLSGEQSGTTDILSQGASIDEDDIEFV